MAEYIGSAEFGKPIEFSSQKGGGRYPNWINTDYSKIFDAIGESVSGAINAQKEAREKEELEKKKNEAEYSILIDKYFIDTPETGDDSEYFLGKTNEYNEEAKKYIEKAIGRGDNYLSPEEIIELKKRSNAILSEKNLSELNQQFVTGIKNKFFEQEGQYDSDKFNTWMEGYNKAEGITGRAKYIKDNPTALIPEVTLTDAAADLRKKNIGTKQEKVGNNVLTVIDPELTEQGIDLLLEYDPQSDVAKYINKGKDEEEKEQRRNNLIKMMGIQTDTKPYRASAARSRPTSSGGKKTNPTGHDPKIGSEYDINFINPRGLQREGTLTDNTGESRVTAVIEEIRIDDNGNVYATGTYKDEMGGTQQALFNYNDNKGAFEGAVGKENIDKMIKSKKKDKTQSTKSTIETRISTY